MSAPLIVGRVELPPVHVYPDATFRSITPGLRQIIEWARTYVDGETCIGDCPRDRLSPEELAGLAELERLEKLL